MAYDPGPCTLCRRPIQPGAGYYRDRDPGDDGGDNYHHECWAWRSAPSRGPRPYPPINGTTTLAELDLMLHDHTVRITHSGLFNQERSWSCRARNEETGVTREGRGATIAEALACLADEVSHGG